MHSTSPFFTLASGLLTWAALTLTTPAEAQGTLGLHTNLRFSTGLNGDTNTSLGNSEGDEGLRVTWGVVGDLDIAILRIVSIGPEIGIYGWQSNSGQDLGIGENFITDLNAVVRLRLPLGKLHLYGAVPVGFTLSVPQDEYAETIGSIGKVKPGVGYNFGLRAGAQYWAWKNLGLVAEFAYASHRASHPVDKATESGDLDIQLEQLIANFGIALAL